VLRGLTRLGGDHSVLPGLSRRAARPLLGDLVDSHVDQDHDDARREEGADGGVEDVPALVVQLALGASLAALLPSFAFVQREQGREGDGGGDEPHHHDGGFDAFGGPLAAVRHPGNRQVAVQRDGAQVHDGGGAEQHVQRQVDLAPQGFEVPVAEQLVGQGEGDDECGHQDVRGGQRHEEQILRSPESPARQNGYDDHDVPHDGEDDHQGYGSGEGRRGFRGVRGELQDALVAGHRGAGAARAAAVPAAQLHGAAVLQG